MIRIPLHMLASASVLALSLQCASAQTSAENVQIDAINVVTEQNSGAKETVAKARQDIQRTPGGVAVVASEEYRSGAATTIKDMLDFTPGVFAQPKFGEDTRLSIRGSGLSRNFHLRGIKILQDGIPLNTADGSGDFQEIDPLTLLYTEVYKGSNALRFGSSTMGGAINLVSPTGRDVPPLFGRAEIGSFGFRRGMVGSGGVHGAWDYFVAGSWIVQDGYRPQSQQDSRRLNGNIGYRFNDNVETRFYFNVNDIQQEIPGSLTRIQALTNPKLANSNNVFQNYQRNIQSERFGSKTTVRIDDATSLSFGGYYLARKLDHPIFQYIDYTYQDWGLFANFTNEHQLGGNTGKLLIGTNIGGGYTRTKQFLNVAGRPTVATAFGDQRALNVDLYSEYQYFLHPQFALVMGGQLTYADREANVVFGGRSGSKDFSAATPKIGALWQIDPTWQAFANISRSFEPPPLSELSPNFNPVPANISAQTGWTAEIGTRGRRENYKWDVTAYRSWINDEFQFFDLGGGASAVRNAEKTIHQGVELGFGVNLLGVFLSTESRDKLWLNVAYTYSDFHFDGDRQYGNNKIPGAPEHYLRGELTYQNATGFYFGPNVEWVPKGYFADNANTVSQKTKSYALLGFKAGYDMENGLGFFVDARNLTDEKYISNVSVTGQATVNSALYVPGGPRAVYGGIRYKW
jgi:iron complex outermembrane recepter protein